jgi:hypothetical protein
MAGNANGVTVAFTAKRAISRLPSRTSTGRYPRVVKDPNIT